MQQTIKHQSVLPLECHVFWDGNIWLIDVMAICFPHIRSGCPLHFPQYNIGSQPFGKKSILRICPIRKLTF